jgi:hypothetical protein
MIPTTQLSRRFDAPEIMGKVLDHASSCLVLPESSAVKIVRIPWGIYRKLKLLCKGIGDKIRL